MATSILKPSMTHTQDTAANVWNIEHNLSTLQPAINVWVSVGGVMTAILPKEIRVIDADNLRVTFTDPQTGSAVVN
jgi:hypothetical protein